MTGVLNRVRAAAAGYAPGQGRPLRGYLATLGAYAGLLGGLTAAARLTGRTAPDRLDTRDVLRAARGPRRTAREVMVGVRSITPQTSLTDAVGLMTRAGQPTAPLVDADGRLLGYVRLFEVLAHFLRQT